MTSLSLIKLPRRATCACAVALLVASASVAQTRSFNRSLQAVQPTPAPAAAAPSPIPLPLHPTEQPQVVIRSYARPALPYTGAAPVDTSTMGGPAASGMPWTAAAGPISSVDIARSFLGADANRDGELTRAEAARLTIFPVPFEEMDLDRDGILSRSEYDDGVRR